MDAKTKMTIRPPEVPDSGVLLDENKFEKEPFKQFSHWFEKALEEGVRKANAMILATADETGKPSARTVLLQKTGSEGFYFCTHTQSRKAEDMKRNPRGALVFYWPEQERQVRVEGEIEMLSGKDSEPFFRSQSRDMQLAVCVSRQKEILKDRSELESRYENIRRRYEGRDIPVPGFWRVYCLKPGMFEFWQSAPRELHDRIRYSLGHHGWSFSRMEP